MRRRLRDSLAAKLLVGQLLVVAAGAITLLLTAVSVGPGIYRRHVRSALGTLPDDVMHHLNTAFGNALIISLAIATAVAVLTAVAVSLFTSRRVVTPIREIAQSSERIARGAYDERVPVAGGDELAELAAAFNEMADSLQGAEQRRRELISDVAHELRTPLATIDAYLDALDDGVLPDDHEARVTLRAQTRRLGRLAEDLQRVSRVEERQIELHIKPEHPQDLVADAVRAADPAYARQHIVLTGDCVDDLPTVDVDRDRIGEVLANLVENALGHTPSGGHVTVRASQDGPDVRLQVIDDGDGIAEQDLERIFERFYRVDAARDRAHGGSGLGLAIARALVEAHHGTISAQSGGPGNGATFTVTLPSAGRRALPQGSL